MKQLYLLLFLQFCFCSSIYAQEQFGSINGIVTNAETGEALPFANVNIDIGGKLVSTTTDFYGVYQLDSIPVGIYTMTFSFIGMFTKKAKETKVKKSLETTVNIQLIEDEKWLKKYFYCGDYHNPPLFSDDTRSGIVVRRSRNGLFYPSNIR